MAVIVQIDAYDPVAAAAVSIYAGSHDDPAVCHYDGQTWWPVLGKLPTLRYDLFDGAFTGQITAPSSSLSMQIEPWPDFGRYILADGRFRLWTGGPDAAGVWTLRFDGRVTGQPNIVDGTAQIEFAVDDRWLDSALLATYAGTTGAEGPAGLKGQAKPLAIGAPRYVPGKLIDSVNSVFQVSAYGSIVSFDTAMERLARFSTSVGDYASYAALVAASIPAGRWGSAKAVGMARFGAPPVGQVSFLLQGDNSGTDGHVRKPGAITRRIAALSGGTGKTDDTSLNALDTARPYNLSLYFEDQTTARAVIQNLAASVNAVAGVSWTGKLFVLPVAIGTATVTLAADGSALPPVARVEQIEIASPWQKLAITAERTWAVHALSDIAFTAELIDVGAYTSGTTYREGNIVSLADGSRWVYTATTPTSGNTPATGSAFWNNYAAATQPDFASVVGPTRPDDNATRNDDGANMLTSPLKLDQVILQNGAVIATGANGPSIQLFTPGAIGRWGPPVPCRPNETLFLDYALRSDGAGAETSNSSYTYFNAALEPIGAVNLSDLTQTTLDAVAGIDATIRCSFVTPSTAYYIQP